MFLSKTITFGVPCFNSAEYLDVCVKSLLEIGLDIEIILVDDGSTKDNTAQKVDEWAAKYPDIIVAKHQENGGHGAAVNTALKFATGRYFKVVDSDDWLDKDAMDSVMEFLRPQCELQYPTDLVVANYVYEKVFENKRKVINYRNVFPQNRIFTWNDIGHFKPSQYLLMHSVIFRTGLLKDIRLTLPKHCFYVDNIFVYVPLPSVQSIYYLDVDMYRYFIGREGQSVNTKTMIERVDQQLRIIRIMIDSVKIPEDVQCKKLQHYMENYLSMMMCIASILLRMKNSPEAEQKRTQIWRFLKLENPTLYGKVRRNVLNIGSNLPSTFGRKIGLAGYSFAQKLFKFN